jgi:hypothetical protein
LATSPQLFDPEEIVELILLEVLLASAILAVESFRTDIHSLRAVLVCVLVLSSAVIFRMIKALSSTRQLP